MKPQRSFRVRWVLPIGYVAMQVPKSHPQCNSRHWAYEHRVVAALMLGRDLLEGEQVHHIDGDRTNNDPFNLEIYPSQAHHKLHHRLRQDLRPPAAPNPVIPCACGCGESLLQFDESGRPRTYINLHWVKRHGSWNRGRRYEMKSARKTHCKRGHPLVEGNLYISPGNGQRACCTCKRLLRGGKP